MKKIKWFFICIVLCFITVILTSFIPIEEIKQCLNPLIGFVVGSYCITKYLDEQG